MRKLYNAALALPVVPKGVYNCPADDGLQYTLSFSAKRKALQHMTLDATGCQFLSISGMEGARQAYNDQFRALVAQTLAIPTLIPQAADALRIVRQSAVVLHIPPLSKTISDTLSIQRLYNAALALPAMRGSFMLCPINRDINYLFIFLHAKQQLFTMTLHTSGCPTLKISSLSHTRVSNQQFFTLLAQTLGITELDPIPNSTQK